MRTPGLDMEALTRRYAEDGFVALPGFLSGGEFEDFRSRTLALVARLREQEPEEPKGEYAAVRKNLQEHDPWALDFLRRGPQVPIIEALLGDEPVPATFGWFEKRPGERDVVKPHFDAVGRFPKLGATMWIALDAAFPENGCLHYLRGSHKRSFPPKIGIDVRPFAADDRPMVAAPGDAFIHSAATVHWSERNKTNALRRAAALFYWGKRALEAKDKTA